MKAPSLFMFVALFLMYCKQGQDTKFQSDTSAVTSEISMVLDAWHLAASNADANTYFSFFENEDSIFMGTDDTERWTIGEFREWSKPYFDKGKAWSFTGFDRHIYISESGKMAWFDERLNTPNLGPSRGTGVLKKVGQHWKITHYNLSIPIPNDVQQEVSDIIQKHLKTTSK